jgi:hypothetical protein
MDFFTLWLSTVRESLNLMIRYRILREEVESVIESVVAKVLGDSTKHHRITLVNKLVAALEHDAGWVELYGITGELNVPVTPYEQTEKDLCKLLDRAMKVQKILWVGDNAFATNVFLAPARAQASTHARRYLA